MSNFLSNYATRMNKRVDQMRVALRDLETVYACYVARPAKGARWVPMGETTLAIASTKTAVARLAGLVAQFDGVSPNKGRSKERMRPEEVRLAARLYTDEKYTMVQLSEHMGYGTRTLRRELLAAGVVIRGRGSHIKRLPQARTRAATSQGAQSAPLAVAGPGGA